MATKIETLLLARRIDAASAGDDALAYELGVAFSTGTAGADFDLVEAHKWFNLATVWGNEDAKAARADISEDMSAREIATAQRGARDVLSALQRRAA